MDHLAIKMCPKTNQMSYMIENFEKNQQINHYDMKTKGIQSDLNEKSKEIIIELFGPKNDYIIIDLLFYFKIDIFYWLFMLIKCK